MDKIFAGLLRDETHKVELLIHEIDMSTRESILEATKELSNSNHTPEQINGMLGVILANTELLTKEDLETFQGVEIPESKDPYIIKLDETNYPLIYAFLEEQITAEEAVVPYQNLPLASKDTSWDEGEARKALREWSDGNWGKYKRGFLWFDSSAQDKAESYKFPIATINNGRLTAVPKAIYSSAGYLNKANIPSEDKNGIRAHLSKYYNKLGETPPWKKREDLEEDVEFYKTMAEELEEKLKAYQVLPYRDLPITQEDIPWNEDESIKSITEWATTDEVLDETKYAEAFLHCSNGKYSFPIAIVMNNSLTVTKGAIEAATGQVETAQVPEIVKNSLKDQLSRYCVKLGIPSPWQEVAEISALKERIASMTEINVNQEKVIDDKTQELEASKEVIAKLEGTLAEMATVKHELLAKEAANLAIRAKHPLASKKSFEELVSLLITRKEDSIRDFISDLEMCGSDDPIEAPIEDKEPSDESITILTVEPIEDPVPKETSQGPLSDIIPGETSLQAEIYNSLEESEEEVWKLFKVSKAERKALEDKIAKTKAG